MDPRQWAEEILRQTPPEPRGRGPQDVNKGDKGIHFVLHTLAVAKGPMTCGEIAKHAPFSTARLAALLNKMEDRGLVIRKNAKEDARKTYVELTPKGKKLHDDFHEKMISGMARVIELMGPEDMKEFHRLSQKMRACMKQAHEEGSFPEESDR